MKLEIGLHQLVYEYFESRIVYGLYRYGDQLPSISKISAIFHMAPATVRSALTLLEKSGYIRVDARKASKVIYKADSQKFREHAAKYFLARKEGITDLMQSGDLLLDPLWEAGLEQWKESEWEILRTGLAEAVPGAASMPVEFYLFALGALDNRLIMNFYWEIIRYIRFPYLADLEEQRQEYPELKNETKEGIIASLKQIFEQSYVSALTDLFAFIDWSQMEYQMDDSEQIPFRWNIYRQRPQIRYTLVSRIIREVIGGQYPIGTYLPSLPQMAEKYEVSLNTIRRTLSMLSALGITRSQHGKGTLVCMEPSESGFTKPEIREGMRLYQESLQFITLTIRQISLYTLEQIPKEKTALKERFISLYEKKTSYLCFDVYLSFLIEKCPLMIVKECYGRLLELLIWGYPIVILRTKKEDLNEQYSETVKQITESLKTENPEEFADLWKALMEEEVIRFREWMESLDP